MFKKQEAGTAGGGGLSLPPMEQWQVPPLWAWVVGAVIIIGIWTFACVQIYESQHAARVQAAQPKHDNFSSTD